MKPNYKTAAEKAYEIRYQYGTDPLIILRRFPNVMVISFESSDMPVHQDSFTCVDKNKYIVFYNSSLSHVRLRSALARELGHVVLQHDGKDPEDIWDEEATCFAYHFLCPPPSVCVEIKYRPECSTISMSFKSMQTFHSMHALKKAIAEEQTRSAKYIGRPHITYTPDDVDIRSLNEEDFYGNWKNFSAVVVGGRSVGYCGE